jgi:quercetin dioxygenase-like cupin family protein
MAVFNSIEGMDPKPVQMEGASDVSIRVLLGPDLNVPNFILRVFDVEPGGYTPKHTHPFEHEIFVLEGRGEIVLEDGPNPLSPGDAAIVYPDELHQFRNSGDEVFRFICIIPRGDQ